MGLRWLRLKQKPFLYITALEGILLNGNIVVENIQVQIGDGIKYLGLYLDNKWEFREHFRRLAPRLEKTAASLGRLMPNIGGPRAGARKLYANVLHSTALYGAPIWAGMMEADNQIKVIMHRAQRTMAIRTVRCCRIVSYRAATTLAGIPPIELLAKAYQETYRRVKQLKEEMGHYNVTQRTICTVRAQAKREINRRWIRYLATDEDPGRRVVEALRPHLNRWVDRSKEGITFHRYSPDMGASVNTCAESEERKPKDATIALRW